MENRLNESALQQVYESGSQGFSWISSDGQNLTKTAAQKSLRPLGKKSWYLSDIDFNAILAKQNAKELIEAISPQKLLHALYERGLEETHEVLSLISTEQLVRMFDYDTWQEDRISLEKSCFWLKQFQLISPKELYTRFRSLEEEYQIALLNPIIELIDAEEYEKMATPEKDKQIYTLPCNKLYYRIKSNDQTVHEVVGGLVEASLAEDIGYTYSLLQHSFMMPPKEQEALAAQFRKARLEEDGFVSFEESLEMFMPIDLDALKKKWSSGAVEGASTVVPKSRKQLFLIETVDFAKRMYLWEPEQETVILNGFMFLANALCSSCFVGPDQPAGLKLILEHVRSLSSLGLEVLSKGDPLTAARILASEHPKNVFKAGLSLINEFQRRVLTSLETWNIPHFDQIKKYFTLNKRARMLVSLDEHVLPLMGYERTEILKALFNKFPLCLLPENDQDNSLGEIPEQRLTFKPIESLSTFNTLVDIVNRCLVKS